MRLARLNPHTTFEVHANYNFRPRRYETQQKMYKLRWLQVTQSHRQCRHVIMYRFQVICQESQILTYLSSFVALIRDDPIRISPRSLASKH